MAFDLTDGGMMDPAALTPPRLWDALSEDRDDETALSLLGENDDALCSMMIDGMDDNLLDAALSMFSPVTSPLKPPPPELEREQQQQQQQQEQQHHPPGTSDYELWHASLACQARAQQGFLVANRTAHLAALTGD